MNTRLRPVVLIAVCMSLSAAGLVDPARACSQRMCGTPLPAGVLGGVVPMQFTYGIEECYLSKTSGLDDGPGEEQELDPDNWNAATELKLIHDLEAAAPR